MPAATFALITICVAALMRPRASARATALCQRFTPRVYLRERLLDFFGAGGADQLRAFVTVLEEDERRPELHLEGAAEALAARVRDLDVSHARMGSQSFRDERLRAAAVAAPGAAELEQRRALHRVDLFALGLDLCVVHGHSDAPSNLLILSEPRSKSSRQRRLIAAIGLPERSFASASGWMPQVGQK